MMYVVDLLNDYVSTDGWICECCKHFHLGVRDRCDKDNNWVLKDGSCQDFERVRIGGINEW